MSKEPITLFAEVPDTYPDWLDGATPILPLFEKDAAIQAIVLNIKGLLYEKILEGCSILLESYRPRDQQWSEILILSLRQNPVLWKAVISGHKYGFNYLCSRVDASNLWVEVINRSPPETRIVNKFLSEGGAATRAINYGIRKYLEDDTIKTTLAKGLVPQRGIISVGFNKLVVLESDFKKYTPEVALSSSHALYDFHDFSCMATSALNEKLYGNKYQSSLPYLRKAHAELITSPGHHDLSGCLFSDAMLFTELLTGLFTQQLALLGPKQKTCTYQKFAVDMGTKLAMYLLGKLRLYHPGSDQLVEKAGMPTPHQLAILAQNKAYELPAAEMEQKVFTRGGPPNDRNDELNALNPLQRIEALGRGSCLRRWMYFEARHTLKHRAQVEAYIMVSRYMVVTDERNVEICGMIQHLLYYEDVVFMQKRRNLWKVIAAREWDEMTSDEKWEILGGREKETEKETHKGKGKGKEVQGGKGKETGKGKGKNKGEEEQEFGEILIGMEIEMKDLNFKGKGKGKEQYFHEERPGFF